MSLPMSAADPYDKFRGILQHGSIWTIAEQVNELRNLQGTGHGRTMHMGVSEDLALLVISRSLFGG
ncbi:abortive infection family protein [Nesterenkonia populi]|uniref:abortive infection family protein n=1 Tax=Nesterenkonia populi TaxID=1591087 RepID=UPI0011BDF570